MRIFRWWGARLWLTLMGLSVSAEYRVWAEQLPSPSDITLCEKRMLGVTPEESRISNRGGEKGHVT